MRLRCWGLAFVFTSCVGVSAQPRAVASCASSADCSQLAIAAIARSEFEHAHDLAWRAVQLGRRNDTAWMYLLARTQSLSGRPDDALVMLRRLAALGFRTDEPETHDDFRRVRSLPAWPETLAAIRGIALPVVPPSARTDVNASVGVSAPVASASDRTKSDANVAAAPPAPAPAKPEASAGEATLPGLRVPITPLALAYDSVSDRFVVVDESSDTLKIVDERTGNVIDLVSRGWSDVYRPVTVAIDPRRGDLWAAGIDMTSGTARSALYKLQLVSGRLLQTIKLPDEAGPSRIVDLAIGRDSILLLDAVGRRVFALHDGAGTARVVANLVSLHEPVGIAAASDTVVYIAHAQGLVRIDLTGRSRLPTPVLTAADITNIQSISWHDGSLFAVQRNGNGHTIARIQLDAGGTTATSVRTLGPAASRAAGVYGGVFYYVAADGDGGLILRGTRAR